MKEKDAKQGKMPYVKPELRRIQLRPEEAVLGACKAAASSGPAGANCETAACSSVGS